MSVTLLGAGVELILGYTAIKETSGTAPHGWYYGHIESEGGARSRGIVARVFKEEGVPLKSVAGRVTIE